MSLSKPDSSKFNFVVTTEQEEPHEQEKPFVLDAKDSVDPSYTNLVLPYRVICRQRYHRTIAKQRAQFIKEIKLHELLQLKALDGVRIHREFCDPVLSKPFPGEMIKLTNKQKMRIEQILSTTYSV